MRLRLSGPARTDLAGILATSHERWGREGRDRYARLLAAALRTLARRPTGPTTRARDDDLLSGIRSFHIRHANRRSGVRAPVHVVYYRVLGANLVEVVRVLHERMDPGQHIGE